MINIVKTQKVYFIQAEVLKYIKIGVSVEPIIRMAALQAGSPDKLILAGLMYRNEVYEGLLHERFNHLRLHGEWFKPGVDLIEFIKEEAFDPLTYYEEILSSNSTLANFERAKIKNYLEVLTIPYPPSF